MPQQHQRGIRQQPSEQDFSPVIKMYMNKRCPRGHVQTRVRTTDSFIQARQQTSWLPWQFFSESIRTHWIFKRTECHPVSGWSVWDLLTWPRHQWGSCEEDLGFLEMGQPLVPPLRIIIFGTHIAFELRNRVWTYQGWKLKRNKFSFWSFLNAYATCN